MRGVILAAGKGSRLSPLTKVIPKPMLPVYDKPMIYYSVDIMKMAKIEEVMIVVSKSTEEFVKKQLGNGSEFGLKIHYGLQKEQLGTVDAFRVCEDFILGHDSLLLYADNIFLGDGLESLIEEGVSNLKCGYASIGICESEDPRRYGVVSIDNNRYITAIEEKPENPKSNLIVTGITFFPSDVVLKLPNVQKSARGEYEMADVFSQYINLNRFKGIPLGRDTFWYDAGTFDTLIEASEKACDIKNN